MKKILKYDNLKDSFPHLLDGLCGSIQSEYLDIKRIKCTSDTLVKISSTHPKMIDAYCVIYSPYIAKENRDYETFIFIDEVGNILEHISGRKMQLYGMLDKVDELRINDEYKEHKNVCRFQ